MPFSAAAAAATATLLLLPPPDADRGMMLPVRLPGNDQNPMLRDGLPNVTTPQQPDNSRKRFFGLGIRFENRGNSQGIGLDQVVAGSPAERMGFVTGTVITEINGVSTVGRSAEECTRLVRDAGNNIVLKYYDPATLKLKVRTLVKDWFLVGNIPD